MKVDEVEFKVRHYIRTGTKKLSQQDVNFEIKRHVRENYIGISNLTACGRLLWARYNKPEINTNTVNDPEQLIRIFDLGHLIEDMTLKIMIAGGASLNNNQIEFSDFDNKVRGHLDSILDKEHVLEIKSMNDHSFESFVHLGAKVSHYVYYVQVQMYMYYAKLYSAVIVATNKNNSRIDCEHIIYDHATVQFHLEKIKAIVECTNYFAIPEKYLTLNKCNSCALNKICYSKSIKI